MTRYVIDPVTLLRVVDEGPAIAAGHQLVAPSTIRSDALQLLLDDVRGGKREEKEALRTHDRITELKMRLLGDRVSRATAFRLAQEHGLDVRAAEYLAVTKLQADALVTVDDSLRRIAEGLVPLADVEALGR